MPLWLVEAYAEAIPAIEAREALHHVTIVALGAGTGKKEETQRITAAWRRAANAGRPGKRRGLLELVSGHGFGVVQE